jgi:hypothetical protein
VFVLALPTQTQSTLQWDVMKRTPLTNVWCNVHLCTW